MIRERWIFIAGLLVGGLMGVGTCAVAQPACEPCEIVIAPEMCEPHCEEIIECEPPAPCPPPVECPPLECDPCPEPDCEPVAPIPCCPEPKVRVGWVERTIESMRSNYDIALGAGHRRHFGDTNKYAIIEATWFPWARWGVRVGGTWDFEETRREIPAPYCTYKPYYEEDRSYAAHVLAVRRSR